MCLAAKYFFLLVDVHLVKSWSHLTNFIIIKSAAAEKVTGARKKNKTQGPAAGGNSFPKVVGGKQKVNCIRRDRQRAGWSDLT